MNYRDLEAARQIIDKATGLDITYAYEDLVFPEHGAFILQFDDDNTDKLHCYFHEDCNEKDSKNIFANLFVEASKKKCMLVRQGAFTLEQKEENIQIKFL
jgi:hypothetical protein